MATLSPAIQKQVSELFEAGEDLADEEKFAEAMEKYQAAWTLLPEPKTSHEAALWLLGAIADVNVLSGDFAAGRENTALALQCPGGAGDPMLHLRLGQCEFELGNLNRAADELATAYEGTGGKVFDDEGDKYFAFLKSRRPEPPGGW